MRWKALARSAYTCQNGTKPLKLRHSAVRILLSIIMELLGNNVIGISFIAAVKKDKPRYALEQLRMLKKILERYPKNDIIDGMEFCLERKLYCVTELLVWLIAKFGIESGKEIYHMRVWRLYMERAARLKEELYGRD